MHRIKVLNKWACEQIEGLEVIGNRNAEIIWPLVPLFIKYKIRKLVDDHDDYIYDIIDKYCTIAKKYDGYIRLKWTDINPCWKVLDISNQFILITTAELYDLKERLMKADKEVEDLKAGGLPSINKDDTYEKYANNTNADNMAPNIIKVNDTSKSERWGTK